MKRTVVRLREHNSGLCEGVPFVVPKINKYKIIVKTDMFNKSLLL